MRITTYGVRLAQRRKFGPDWRCGACGLVFLAAGYGINNRRTATELHNMCVEPGYWRCCTACAPVLGKLKEWIAEISQPRTCLRCMQPHHKFHFVDKSTVCNACILYSTYIYTACSECAKPHMFSEMREKKQGDHQFVCYVCAQEGCSRQRKTTELS